MNFLTKIPIHQQENNLIDYNSKLLLIGSCFSENIGSEFDYFKFQNTINPFGILFHPKAIEALIVNVIEEKEFTEQDIFFHNEQWHCFDAHSLLSNTSKEVLLQQLNERITATKTQLQEVSHIIITLGTSWVYNHIANDKTVANCHKVPQKEFEKQILSVDTILQSLENIEKSIRRLNKKASVIFTVSPVRHIKDGFVENTQSKAHLITAIHQFLVKNPQNYYFPSYEIMMDELRDYRFYKGDMLHPNEIAVNYIWERFKQTWISPKAEVTMKEVAVIQKGLRHKPFNPSSKAHLQFVENIKNRSEQLLQKHPFMEF